MLRKQKEDKESLLTCTCGGGMKRIRLKEAYGVAVKCDRCRVLMKLQDIVYHCTTPNHNFDYCVNCGDQAQKKDRYRSGKKSSNAAASSSSSPRSSHKESKVSLKCGIASCRAKMKVTTPGVTYGHGALCNECFGTIESSEQMYHCRAGKCKEHAGGFDYCLKCAFVAIGEQKKGDHSGKPKAVSTVTALQATVVDQKKQIRRLNDEQWRLMRQIKDLKQEREELKKGINYTVECPCGELMILTKPGDAYGDLTRAECDNKDCEAMIHSWEWLYHCPNDRIDRHPLGYDVCLQCALKRQPSVRKLEKVIAEQQHKLDGFEDTITPILSIILRKQLNKISPNMLEVVKELQKLNKLEHVIISELIAALSVPEPGPLAAEGAALEPSQEVGAEGEKGVAEEEEKKEELMDSPKLKHIDRKYTVQELQTVNTHIDSYVETQQMLSHTTKLLLECSEKCIQNHMNHWSSWSSDEIVDWIITLDNEAYKNYEATMREKMKSANVKGNMLPYVDKSDLEGFGVHQFGDRIGIHQAIKTLVDSQQKPNPDVVSFSTSGLSLIDGLQPGSSTDLLEGSQDHEIAPPAAAEGHPTKPL